MSGTAVLLSLAVACSAIGAREVDGIPASENSSTSPEPTPSMTVEPSPSRTPEQASEEPSDEPSESTAPSSSTDPSPSTDPSAPPPAESEAQTLCNLTREYIEGLYRNGRADDGGYMDVAALSLSDSLRVWRGLVVDFPETEESVDAAQNIYDLWSEALAAQSEGDMDAYEGLLAESETYIEDLPAAAETTQVCT